MFGRKKKAAPRRDPITWWDMPERLTKKQRKALAEWMRHWSNCLDHRVAVLGTEGIHKCQAAIAEMAARVEGSDREWQPPIQNMSEEQIAMVSRLNAAVKAVFPKELYKNGFVMQRVSADDIGELNGQE